MLFTVESRYNEITFNEFCTAKENKYIYMQM